MPARNSPGAAAWLPGRLEAAELERDPPRARASAPSTVREVAAALRLALAPYLVSRLVLFAAGWAAVATLGYARAGDPRYPAPLETWLGWDAVHYLRLAAAGYPASASAADSGFFPLLPAALHLLGSDPIAAVVLAFLLGLAALTALAGLTRSLLGEDAARRTAWVACWWPEAFVFSAVYTEGPFLLLAVGATWAAWRRRPVLAAALGGAAALLRPTGLLLALPMLLMLPRGRARLAALAPPLAAAGFGAFLWLRTGEPLAFLVSQRANHPVQPGALPLQRLAEGRPDDLLGLACLLIAGLLAARLWRMPGLGSWRLPALALTAALLLPALASGTLSSFGRYAAAAFPLFWAASTVRLGRLAPFAVPAAAAVVVACASGRVTP